MNGISDFVKTVFPPPLADDKKIILTSESWLPLIGGNQNLLVIGGPGSGKTRSFLMPNVLQMQGTYVIGSCDDSIVRNCGNALEKNGYIIKILDLSNEDNLPHSFHYNPFAYIRSESDILRLVDILMAHTCGNNSNSFWYAAEKLLLYALVGYMWGYGEPEEQNIGTLLDLINAFDIREYDIQAIHKCPLDYLFDTMAQNNPEHFAVRQYKKFKQATGNTAKTIVISCAARLALFDLKAIRDLMSHDELELDKLGDRKTALFIINSRLNAHFNAVAAILYAQVFDRLIGQAKSLYKGKLPLHVSCYLDDTSAYHLPHDFNMTLSVLAGRNISVALILQSVSELKSIFGRNAQLVVDVCGTKLLMNGNGYETLSKISIPTRELEWAKCNHRCIWINDERGVGTGKKYNLAKHPNYSLMADADENNQYVQRKERMCFTSIE